MNINEERYFDFSTDEKDLAAFSPGAGTDPALRIVAEDIQSYLLNKNPILSIRGLIALHVATSLGSHLGSQQYRKTTNILLAVIAAVLAYIAYLLS